jgi:hypothetical protein
MRNHWEVREDCAIADNRGNGNARNRAEVKDTNGSLDDEVLDRYGVEIMQLLHNSLPMRNRRCAPWGDIMLKKNMSMEFPLHHETLKNQPRKNRPNALGIIIRDHYGIEEVKQPYQAEPANFPSDRRIIIIIKTQRLLHLFYYLEVPLN